MPLQAVRQEAEALVAELASRGESARLRGPSLAAVELQRRRLRLAEKDGNTAGPPDMRPLTEAIRDVYPQLGGFLSCATDLR